MWYLLIICLILLISPLALIFIRRYLATCSISTGRGQTAKHYVLSILDEDGVRSQSEGHHERSHIGIQIARDKLTKGTKGAVVLRVDRKGKQTLSGFLPGLNVHADEGNVEESV